LILYFLCCIASVELQRTDAVDHLHGNISNAQAEGGRAAIIVGGR